jgi:hypothetical protein
MTKKLVRFSCMAIFVSYCPQFWSSRVIYKAHDTQYMFERHDKKTRRFCVLEMFLWAITHSFGISGWFTRPMTLSTFFRGWPKTRRFCILGPFSWVIAHSFRVPEWFTRSMTLSTCLRGMTKNSSFLHFRAVFMSYCPQFWGSRVIYKVHVTQYMFERHDQKLIVSMF